MASVFPKKKLKVALCQLCSTDDVDQNFQVISERIAEVGKTADVVCFPENSLYMRMSNKDDFAGLDLSDPIFQQLSQMAQNYQSHILLGSLPRSLNGRVRNSTIWLSPDGKVEACYDKVNLFDVDVEGARPERESDYFQAGESLQVIDVDGWKVGLSICFDLRFSNIYWEYAKRSVDLLLVPSAFLVPTGRAHWEVLLRARAIESQAFVVAAAQGGAHKSVKFEGKTRATYGHSLAISPWGNVLLDLGSGLEGEVVKAASLAQVVELDPEDLRRMRRQIPMHRE